MKRNPVYDREMRVSSRSLRLPLILLLFNGILFLVALLNMYSVVAQVRTNAMMQYSRFMEMYEFVTTIEFVLLLLIVPAMTSASISGERERQTLDLMLTTQMTAAQVVLGKLMSALSILFLLVVSSFPAVLVSFVYGGITWGDWLLLLVCYVTVAFLVGSAGICFSSVFKRSTVSTVVTYGVLIAVVAGTYFINRFALSLSSMNMDRTAMVYGFGENMAVASAGGVFYLFLLNPAVTFLAVMSGQTGRNTPMFDICSRFGMEPSGFVMEHWIPISILIQLLMGIVMIVIAVRFVEPVKRRRRK